MRSVLLFLQETEKLLNEEEDIKKSVYAGSTVARLRTYRERLKNKFDEEPDNRRELTELLSMANTLALQLEKHFMLVDDKYRKIYKMRAEAETTFNAMNKIFYDMEHTGKLKDESSTDVMNLVQYLKFIHDYYVRSQFYVWKIEQKDIDTLTCVQKFMEDYGHDSVININSSTDSNS